jgi:hypothetical protein
MCDISVAAKKENEGISFIQMKLNSQLFYKLVNLTEGGTVEVIKTIVKNNNEINSQSFNKMNDFQKSVRSTLLPAINISGNEFTQVQRTNSSNIRRIIRSADSSSQKIF